jgi:NTE family protein
LTSSDADNKVTLNQGNIAPARRCPLGKQGVLEMSARDPSNAVRKLTPEVIGTTVGDLIAPCHEYEHAYTPERPSTGPPIALAFSGGGFRATLAGIGVLRFLADARLLGNVRYVSSVSGGSIANGIFARAYPGVEARGFSPDAFAEVIQDPAIDRISTGSLSSSVIRSAWQILGPKTRTMLLANKMDEWFFDGLRLEDLPLPCRYVFNAANLTTGVRFGFEREHIGDYVLGTTSTRGLGLRLADAVAASAAIPGLLAAYTPKATFPCGNGRTPKLVDGGAYENTAMEPIDSFSDVFVIALNAGGIFRTGPFGWVPIVRDLQRAEGLLYRQSTGLRMREMVRRFRLREDADRQGVAPPADARWGVLFGLATTLEPAPFWTAPPLAREEQLRLAQFKTSFAAFDVETCRNLVYQGWWLTGASITRYHPGFLPGDPPEWTG